MFLNHPLSPFRLRRAAENDQDDERGDIFFRAWEEVEGLGMGNFSRCFNIFRNQKLLYKSKPLFLTYTRQCTVFLRHSSRLFDGFFPHFYRGKPSSCFALTFTSGFKGERGGGDRSTSPKKTIQGIRGISLRKHLLFFFTLQRCHSVSPFLYCVRYE